MEKLPSILLPRKGCFGLIDDEKASCPDQYASHMLPLNAFDELAAFFGQFLLGRHTH